MKLATHRAKSKAYKKRLSLSKTKTTTVHVVRYARRSVRPRIVLFDKATRLLDYCEQNNVDEAITGGFFLRESHKLLGDLWIDGAQLSSVPFTQPWGGVRGAINIDTFFGLKLDARQKLPKNPTGDLLQAGPLLVKDGQNLVINTNDAEGFSQVNEQFDSDITIGRYPRAAIGLNDQYVFSVVCEGRARAEAGLSMEELADFMISLGVESALNLDGGSSASLISDRKLLNTPRSPKHVYRRGRKIYSAITLEVVV